MNYNVPLTTDNPERTAESDWQKLLELKIRLAGAITNERFGTPNPQLKAELLYDLLVHPERAADMHEVDLARFSDRQSIVEAEALDTCVDLERAEFVQFMLSLVRDAKINRESMVPGFEQALTAFVKRGPTTIWTQGDVFGEAVDGDGTAIAGRGEQLWKLRGGGIAALRRGLAQTALGAHPPQDHRGTLDVIAVEDKFAPPAIDRLAGRLDGVDRVIVIEDRLDYIARLRGLLGARGIWGAEEFWVHQGAQVPPDDITKVGSVLDVAATIPTLAGRIGSVVDFDGVLSSQKRRAELTAEAVGSFLRSKGAVPKG